MFPEILPFPPLIPNILSPSLSPQLIFFFFFFSELNVLFQGIVSQTTELIQIINIIDIIKKSSDFFRIVFKQGFS